MEPVVQLGDILQELSGVGSPISPSEAAANYKFAQWQLDALAGSVAELRADDGFWKGLASRGVSMLAVAKSLGTSMREVTGPKNMHSVAFFASLLVLPGCPASSLFDTFTLTGFLHGLKKAIVPSGSKAAAGKDAEQPADQGADSDEETADGPVAASGLCAGAMRHLAAFLSAFGLSQTPEVAELIIETFTDLVKVLTAKTSKAKGGKVSAADGELHEAAYAVLRALSHGRHGPVLATCGAIFQRLLPVMMVPPAGGSAAAARRVAEGRGSSLAIDYVVATYRENGAHAAEAVCALVRALCMRAPDKADLRAAAANSAVELLAALPPGQQLQLATFALRLSLTAKVTHRLVALEVAAALLVTPPPAFAAAGGAAADEAAASAVRELAADGDAQLGPDVAPAPWHAVCLSVLLRRCNDKVAGVRSKAVAALAEVVEIFRSRLAAGSGGSSADQQQQQQAASYSLQKLLAAAQAVDLVFVEVEAPVEAQQQQGGGGVDAMDVDGAPGGAAAGRQAKTPATGGTDATVADDDDDEDSSAEEGDGQRRRKAAPSPPPPPPHGVHVAVVPRSLSPSLQPLLELAHRRLQDDKALVRRCALQLLEALLLLQGAAAAAASSCASSAPSSQHKPLRSGGDFAPTSRDLAAIEAATADSLVSVRKAALSAACRLLLAFPDHAPCCELWVRSGLPLVRDPESSIQEALADQCLSLLVDRLVACGAGNGAGAAAQAAMLVPLLAGVSGLGRAASSCLNRVLALLAGRKQLKSKPAAKGLEALIGHLHCLIAAAGAAPPAAATQTQAQRQQQQQLLRPAVHGAWMFLTEVAALDASAPSWQFLQEWWTKLRAADGATAAADGGSGVGAEEGAQLLWVISHAAARFPESEAAPLAKQLLQALLHFSLAPAPAAAHIAALHKLTASSAAASEWAAQLMQAAHETLGKLVERKSDMTAAASRRASAALFAVGEAALLRTAKAPANLTLLVQALTAQRLLPSAAAAAEQPGLSSQVPGGGVEVPAQVQAQAWTCLGKLCVVDEALAKKCVPLLVQELSRSPLAVVRNNIMVAMTDLCIHHTAMVDSHVGRLSSCVRDRHELVRLQSLALLANLLMKDYVKWRGALFHRFLLALVDDSPAVRSLATYLLGDTLATKAPLLAYNHFVEALFVLNGCSEGLHAGRISSSLAADDTLPGGAGGAAAANELFCLRGASWEARAKRDTVYRTLLLRMSQEHKFSTAAKLCSEVLAGVADGALPLAECEEVLGDALRLLGSKEIKVSASRLAGGAGDDDGAEGGGGGGGPGGTAATQATAMAAEAAKAKGKIVSAMMKKHLVEGVVPVLIELKHMLQEARHPLLGPLMTCIASMLKDYKNEIEDILVADKQLAKEVLYDMRQTEAAAKAAAAAGKRPGTAGGAALPAAAAAAPSPAAACGRDGKGKRAMLPPGAMPGTPMAAEVLLVETAAAAGGANGSGPSRRPNSRRAAAATAAGSKTPGAAATAPPLFSLKTPGSGMAAAALPLKTPGGGAKTPSTGLTHNGDGQQPARMMATPAPLSAAAKKAAARGDKENAGSGRGVARALAATQSVVLPSPFAERPARQWNVQLEEPPAAGGGGAGGKGKLGSRLRQQSSAAAAAVESTMAGEVEEAAAGAKPAGRGGRAARGAAAKAAKRAAEQEVSEKSDDAFELPASDDNGEGSDSEPAAAARKRKGSAAGGAKRGKSAAARPSAAAAAKAAALAAAAAEAPVAEAGAAAARKRRGR